MGKLRLAFKTVVKTEPEKTETKVVPDALEKLTKLVYGIETGQATMGPELNLYIKDYVWVYNTIKERSLAIAIDESRHIQNLISKQEMLENEFTNFLEALRESLRQQRNDFELNKIEGSLLDKESVYSSLLYTHIEGQIKKIHEVVRTPYNAAVEKIENSSVIECLTKTVQDFAKSDESPDWFVPKDKFCPHHLLQQINDHSGGLPDRYNHIIDLVKYLCELQPEPIEITNEKYEQTYEVDTGYRYPIVDDPILAKITINGELINGTWECRMTKIDCDGHDSSQAEMAAKKLFESDLRYKVSERAGTSEEPCLWKTETTVKASLCKQSYLERHANLLAIAAMEPMETLDEMIKIQCAEGNWNYDPYMHGMANGLLLAKSVFDETHEPKFLEAPEKWLYDK
jgi:hypothetical protein